MMTEIGHCAVGRPSRKYKLNGELGFLIGHFQQICMEWLFARVFVKILAPASGMSDSTVSAVTNFVSSFSTVDCQH